MLLQIRAHQDLEMHCGESLPSCHGPELAKILINASAEELGRILEISRKSLDISKKLEEF